MQFTEGKHILAFWSAEQSECQCSVLLQPLVYVYLDPPCRGRQSEKESEQISHQQPANSTFLSEQISHQQTANIIFLSEQTSHQPPANRTG
jgi:hypothetical protein